MLKTLLLPIYKNCNNMDYQKRYLIFKDMGNETWGLEEINK